MDGCGGRVPPASVFFLRMRQEWDKHRHAGQAMHLWPRKRYRKQKERGWLHRKTCGLHRGCCGCTAHQKRRRERRHWSGRQAGKQDCEGGELVPHKIAAAPWGGAPYGLVCQVAQWGGGQRVARLQGAVEWEGPRGI